MNNICDVCKKIGFVYERKIVDEAFFLCEECDWSQEDIKIANQIGTFMMDLIMKETKEGKQDPN